MTSEDGCVLLSELTVLAQWLGLDRPGKQKKRYLGLLEEEKNLWFGLDSPGIHLNVEVLSFFFF